MSGRVVVNMGRFIFILLLGFLVPGSGASGAPVLAHRLTGEQFTYTIQERDSFNRLGYRYGVEPSILARMHGMKRLDELIPGETLTIDNRHIVPQTLTDGIVINIPQRMLFYFRDDNLQAAYPVSIGEPDWETPTGNFFIKELIKNKPWIVPKSIQEEMRRERKQVIKEFPPGPKNPLGQYWMGLSRPRYGIHSTIAPLSIYQFGSHGCIRLHPDDAETLFYQLTVGTPVKLIYEPVLLAQLGDGRIFLEVDGDPYNKQRGEPLRQLWILAKKAGLTSQIDWQLVNSYITDKAGLAQEVTAAP